MKDKYNREELEAVAAEMNDVMGLTPVMDFNMPDDDTLYTTIVNEATGRGVVKDAIRADDFDAPDNPEKKLFSAATLRFFIEAGVWDAKAKAVIMPKPAAAAAAAAPVEKKAKSTAVDRKAEAAAQDTMEAGEEEPELPLAGKPEPVAKAAKKKEGKAKAAPAAPAGKAPEAEEEPVSKTKKAAAKKGAAKKTVKKAAAKESGPSNKLLVFQAWKHGKGETDVAKLVKHVKGGVTEGTVRGWVSAWGKGKNLPGGVKK